MLKKCELENTAELDDDVNTIVESYDERSNGLVTSLFFLLKAVDAIRENPTQFLLKLPSPEKYIFSKDFIRNWDCEH